MIKEIKRLLDKYQTMAKGSEYVALGQVTNDLYVLLREARTLRIPKHLR